MNKNASMPLGSFTVEAALIFPVIMLVILSVIYIDVHLMNSNIFTCLACEQAVTGNDTKPSSSFALKDIEREVKDSKSERTVSFRTGTQGIWKIFDFDIDTGADYKKSDTEKFIRAMRILKNTILKE